MQRVVVLIFGVLVLCEIVVAQPQVTDQWRDERGAHAALVCRQRFLMALDSVISEEGVALAGWSVNNLRGTAHRETAPQCVERTNANFTNYLTRLRERDDKVRSRIDGLSETFANCMFEEITKVERYGR